MTAAPVHRPGLARRGAPLFAMLVLAACQPAARRLLILDEALTHGAVLNATAQPWHDAGYRVEYRRYYPHLTRRDLDTYRVVILLGGRQPGTASDALDVGDLATLTEWTLRGGVVILGYPPAGTGALDRWLMNRWLAWSGADIQIGDSALRGHTTPGAPPRGRPILTAGLHGTGFDPFPFGTNNGLRVRDPAQVLSRAVESAATRLPGPPIIAASRVAQGLVIVLSRSALGALGPADSLSLTRSRSDGLAGTRAFLVALARWTRRPAEWARIPTAGPREPLRLEGGPSSITYRPPRLGPPPAVGTEVLGRPQARPPLRAATGVPGWIDRQGVRALEADFPSLPPPATGSARLAALNSVTTLLDIGAFNVLLTDAHVGPLADSAQVPPWQRDALRSAWEQVAQHLQTTSVRWIPLVGPRELQQPDSAAPGSPPESCPLDAALWGRLASGVRVLARLTATHTDLIPAVGFSLDETTRGWTGPTVCDAAWQTGLAALTRDSLLTRRRREWLADVPLAARYDSLLSAGLLAAYDSGLADVVRERAATLRRDVRRIRRGQLFAVMLERSPADWFTTSLVQGLSDPDAPVVVFSTDPLGREQLAAEGDVNVVHAIRLDPNVLSAENPERLARAVFGEQDGFWVGPAEAVLAAPNDTLARVLRRLSKER